MSEVILTVPCYNEEDRLSPDSFRHLLDDPRVSLLFVDDGSSDGTVGVLGQIRAAHPGRVDVLALGENQGKAEAVRRGLLRGLDLDRAPAFVGFTDADLSTPPEEVLRLVERAFADPAAAVIGARVAAAGEIDRGPVRRALGRIFSSFGSRIIGEDLRDTQCGAKLFQSSDALREALASRFRSRWAFDVELLGRLKLATGAGGRIVEVPLRRWREVPGSKLGPGSMARAGLDLFGVALDLRRMRRGG